MQSMQVPRKMKIGVLGLVVMMVIFITIQEYSYTYGQGVDNQTGNQTGNQTIGMPSQEEFEEGEEIGEKKTL